MTTRHAPHPLWRFSLRVYRAPGVQQACLALQDDCGADVNLLLLCGWAGSAGRAIDLRRLRRAVACVAAWQTQVIAPVRAARRAIKRDPPRNAESALALRRQVLALELELEYVEQSMLAELAAGWPAPPRPAAARGTTEANLRRYLKLIGHDAHAAAAAHLKTIADACCEPAPRSH